MPRIVHTARYLFAPLLLLSPWGWLELLRSLDLPGPRLVDALPLYEGSRHDTLPLATFLVVWLAVATLACLPFRPSRARLAAALLGLSVFAVAAVVQGAQLELARQADVGVDLRTALGTSFPWLAGGLCFLAAIAVWSRAAAGADVGPAAEAAQ